MVDTDDPQPTMIVLLAIKSAETIIIVENGSLIRSLESRSRLEEYLADRKVKECDQASNKIVIECMRSLTLVRRITTALYILCHKRLVENKVPETISQKSATAIGLGAIIGAGIFVLSGTAIALAGSYALVSFVLVGIIALIVALELGELGSIMPQEKGASYSYVRGAFGSELGFITGLLLYFSYVSSIPVIALGFENVKKTRLLRYFLADT